ncbi:iron ABC transporter permease [Paenibacillus glucanolyticus]|jgi:iron(III) transport system permease protein|uniref:ABC transporter permease n=1 Tax=Paenibacillus TaxID=44249 RepID=UPI0003E200DD|nr:MULTISPECIES: ABC transporter permease subunit [Paenibacillus]ANA78788.1 ABC transporter permease [Paenibacillus glucanolyticus]AVV57298.1 iron ABC transporter permease [Paenibacillus glucanolyticus]ETT35468.1 binding-protein-dependent transport system inner membrane protein [Paenibacillus sp. FSL R5-808]
MNTSEARYGGGVTLLLFVFIFLPLLAVLINVIFPGLFFGQIQSSSLGLIGEIFHRPLWKQSLLNSVTLALGTASFGTIIGGVLATIRARWNFAAARLLDMTAWVLLIAPSFMIAQGWVLFASADGLVHQWLGLTWVTSFIFQPAGLVFVMSLSKFPLAYLAIMAASEWNIRQFGYAARLNGAKPFTVWRTVELPLALPSYAAGWTLVFMDSIGDFGLPAALATVYKFPTLTYSIYSAIYQSPVRFDMAGVLAFYLVLILALAMTLLMVTLRKSRFDFLNARAVKLEKVKPRFAWIYNLSITVFLVVSLGIPIGTSAAVSLLKQAGGGLNAGNFTLDHYRELFAGQAGDHRLLGYLEGMYHSLAIAAAAALFSMLIGFVVAYMLTFTESRLKPLLQLFSIVSLAVPGVVLGIGYIFIWNQKWLEPLGLHLYGKPSLLVIAGIAGAIPYAVRVQLGAFGNLSSTMLKAAAIQGASVFERMRDIVLPMVRQSLLIAILASFGTSVFDLALASMLKPANYSLMPLVIDRAFEFSRYGYATAATVVSCGTVVLIIVLLQAVGRLVFRWLDGKKSR